MYYHNRMEETLTADQQKAEQLIREWFLNTSDQVFVLSGYAGTGKTYLLKRVVEGLGLQAGKEAVFVGYQQNTFSKIIN